LRAPAHGRRACRGDRDDRPPRARGARTRRRRAALERRPDAPGRRALEPPPDTGRGRGRAAVRPRARPRAARRRGRAGPARGPRRAVRPTSVARRSARVPAWARRGARVSPSARNAVLLSLGLVCLSGMVQLAVALGTVTIVAVTGVNAILGLGPAV